MIWDLSIYTLCGLQLRIYLYFLPYRAWTSTCAPWKELWTVLSWMYKGTCGRSSWLLWLLWLHSICTLIRVKITISQNQQRTTSLLTWKLLWRRRSAPTWLVRGVHILEFDLYGQIVQIQINAFNNMGKERCIQESRKCVLDVTFVSDKSPLVGQIEIQGYARNLYFVQLVGKFYQFILWVGHFCLWFQIY